MSNIQGRVIGLYWSKLSVAAVPLEKETLLRIEETIVERFSQVILCLEKSSIFRQLILILLNSGFILASPL